MLFEMLTGRRVFDGSSVVDAIGAALHKDPDWHLLPKTTPPAGVSARVFPASTMPRPSILDCRRMALVSRSLSPDTSGSTTWLAVHRSG